jgi:hypothetical protein
MALSGFRNGCGRFTCDGDIAGRDLKAETRDHRHFATQRRIIDASEACRGRLLQSRGTGELSCRACREASTLRRIPSQAKADAAEAGGNLDGAALPWGHPETALPDFDCLNARRNVSLTRIRARLVERRFENRVPQRSFPSPREVVRDFLPRLRSPDICSEFRQVPAEL